MTVREFNGLGEDLQTGVGDASGMTYGTAATLVKFATVTGGRDWLALHTAPTTLAWMPFALSSSGAVTMFANGVISDFGITLTNGVWYLIVSRKATGTVTPRCSVYNFTTTVWQHANGSSTLQDSLVAPGVSGVTRFSFQGSSGFFSGRVAAQALWSNAVPWTADAAGDAALEAYGLKLAALKWKQANPSAFWLFNQISTATPVADLSVAGTAGQTAITGTSVITVDDPPGFDFTLGSGWKPDYVTVAEFKADHSITSTVDEFRIARDITAASRAVDVATRRQFGVVSAPEQRSYTAEWSDTYQRWVVPIDDTMASPSAVTVTGGTITDYVLKPVNGAVTGRPWTLLVVNKTSAVQPTCERDDVKVTALWGWTATPATVKDATMVQALRFFKRKDAPFGVAGSPDTGSELRLLARVDPDVAVMLRPYVRWDRKLTPG